MDDLRWACAVHEASHAIVSAAVGLRVARVELTDEPGGLTTLQDDPGEFGPVVAIAGDVGVQELLGEIPAELDSFDDGWKAERYAQEVVGDTPAVAFRIARARMYARQIIRENADVIAALARELDRKSTVDGRRIGPFEGERWK